MTINFDRIGVNLIKVFVAVYLVCWVSAVAVTVTKIVGCLLGAN